MSEKKSEKRRKTPPTEKPVFAQAMRLVRQTTAHGEFVRFGWVTWKLETDEITGFEPVPVVFQTVEEAMSVAAQIDQAAGLGILNLNNTPLRVSVH